MSKLAIGQATKDHLSRILENGDVIIKRLDLKPGDLVEIPIQFEGSFLTSVANVMTTAERDQVFDNKALAIIIDSGSRAKDFWIEYRVLLVSSISKRCFLTTWNVDPNRHPQRDLGITVLCQPGK
jgi:hypothetical protein